MTARPFLGKYSCPVHNGVVDLDGVTTRYMPLVLTRDLFEKSAHELSGCSEERRCGVIFKGPGCPFDTC